MTAAATSALLRELEEKLRLLPEERPYTWWRVHDGRTEEEIDRTRAIGERAALETLIAAQRASLEVIRERERKTKAKEA